MVRVFPAAAAGILLFFAAALANSGPPSLPKDQKRIDPPVRFEGIEKYPELIFHLRAGGPYLWGMTVEVKDSKAFPLAFDRAAKDRILTIGNMTLLAMDRKEFEKRSKVQKNLDWLTAKTAGVLAVDVPPPALIVPLALKTIPVTTYRVSLNDGKLAAEKVADKQGPELTPSSPLPTMVFGVLSSLSIAWLGLLLARRGAAAKTPRN